MMNKKVKKYVLVIMLSVCMPTIVNADQQEMFNTLLIESTAFSLGLTENDFTIDNQRERGVKTTYQVNTHAGKEYRCYVTGYVDNLTGLIMSDAMCQEKGKAHQNPLLR